jgi:hypothetical protein
MKLSADAVVLQVNAVQPASKILESHEQRSAAEHRFRRFIVGLFDKIISFFGTVVFFVKVSHRRV